jgi:hypothetical protein
MGKYGLTESKNLRPFAAPACPKNGGLLILSRLAASTVDSWWWWWWGPLGEDVGGEESDVGGTGWRPAMAMGLPGADG